MSEITTGLRSVLNNPKIYDLLQSVMGARFTRKQLVQKYIRPLDKCRILDIGCGTARILDYLPEVAYHGFDLSQRYIDDASRRYGARGFFSCTLLEQSIVDSLEPFDIVIATGVLHHLNDDKAVELIQLAHSALRNGGRLITIDPCYTNGQNLISRYLVSCDRGQNVRSDKQYPFLASTIFSQVNGDVKHRFFIPYTHWIMECQK